MTTDTTQPDNASTPADEATLPTTIEYSGDTSEQEIKLDLADRVSSTDDVTDIEDVSIVEQDDGTQVAAVTWTLADGGTTGPEQDPAAAAGGATTSDQDREAVTPDTAGAEVTQPAAGDEQAADEVAVSDDAENATGATTDHSDDPADTADASAPGGADQSPPRTFEAAIEVGLLRDVLAPVAALVEECRVHVDDDGLSIRVVDPAQVAMTDLELSAEAFAAYEAEAGTLGVSLDRLQDVLNMGGRDELVQFSFDPERGKLTASLDTLDVTMALISPGTIRSEPDIPDLDLAAAVTCDRAALKRTVTATDMVSDHVRLAVEPDAEQFVAGASGDTDEVRLEWAADDLVAFSPGDAEALFALEYLKDLVGAIPRNTDVGLSLGEDFPCVLSYTIADGVADVECMLAPRIRED